MDTGPLVVPPLKTGRDVIVFLRNDGFAVDAAFWYLLREASEWRLCVASPQFAGAGVSAGYKALVSRKNESVPADQINVSGSSDRFVTDALAFAESRGRRDLALVEDVVFGSTEVSAVYFYDVAPRPRVLGRKAEGGGLTSSRMEAKKPFPPVAKKKAPKQRHEA